MKKIYEQGNADWYMNVFKTFEKTRNGQLKTEFHRKRQQAIKIFQNLGFPTTRHEEWKYTNVATLQGYDFQLSRRVPSEDVKERDLEKFNLISGNDPKIVFINGYFHPEYSNIGDLKTQIEILSFAEALEKNHPVLKKHFAKYAAPATESFISLNTAFVQDGTLINIPDNQHVDVPLHLIYLTLPGKSPEVSFPRNLIVAGKSSQLTFVETYAALSEGVYFTNSVSEIYMAANAHVERIKIQNENNQAYHISALHALQERDSQFVDHNVNLGSQLSRNNISTRFNDEGGTSVLNGLYAGNEEQLMDNHTAIDHAHPHCESHELYKGILDHKARGVFNGKIFVRPDAQKTNAIQSNNCILLSDEATIDTKPQLEIFADDVKCTHGATVGQLDEDAYFYMRARGINKEKARKLLIYAFASEVIDKIEQDGIRDEISRLFENKLVQVRLD